MRYEGGRAPEGFRGLLTDADCSSERYGRADWQHSNASTADDEEMSLEYLVPLALGAALVYFAEDVVHARRFGPVTDGARSSETGGVAFRALGFLLIGVGVLELLATHVL